MEKHFSMEYGLRRFLMLNDLAHSEIDSSLPVIVENRGILRFPSPILQRYSRLFLLQPIGNPKTPR